MPGLLLDPAADSRQCLAVLASLCQHAPASSAAAFLHDMRRWGVAPTRPDHRAVLDALLKEGNTAEAYQIVAEQIGADGVAPGLPEFELMLRAFRGNRDHDAVEEVFDEMLLRGIVPTARVHGVYFAALCDKGDLAGARRMLGCVERAGGRLDVATFGVVVAGCVAAGDVDAAREVAREAVRRGLRWDATAMAELVHALRAAGHVVRAREVLLEILRDGCADGMDASALLKQQLISCGGALCDDEEAATMQPDRIGGR